ncbi:hypothetical protein SISSUDRAFT_976242, partial [Sistotremastrum suecicum HHB10207 ss-3]
CQHFVRFYIHGIMDCEMSNCTKSIRHPKNCHKDSCIQNWGPEIQRIYETIPEGCHAC